MSSRQFEVSFVVEPITDPFDERIERAEDAALGLVVSNSDRLTTVTVLVEASSAFEAALSAARTLEESGIRVERSYPDYVTRGDIADRLEVSRQAVGMWARGERKTAIAFPAPASEVAGGIWLWRDVVVWAQASGAATVEAVGSPTLEDHARIDTLLAAGLDRMSFSTYASEVPLPFSGRAATKHVERHYQRTYALAS